MAALMKSFSDDFEMPGLDRSKWQDPSIGTSGTLTFPQGKGMQLYPATTGQNVGVDSRVTYDLTDNYARIKLGDTYGVLLTNTATEVSFYVTTQTNLGAYRAYFIVYSSGGVWKLEARMYNAANASQTLSGTVTKNWSPTAMKYWRHYHTAAGRHYWQYSADGDNWITLAYKDGTAAMTAMYASFRAGNGTAAGQYFTIRYFNTMTQLDRGSGYVNDDFDSYPILAIPTYSTTPPEQWGQWINKTGTQSIIQDPDDSALGQNVLSIVSGVGVTATVLTQTRTTIKDVDFSFKIRIQAQTASPVFNVIWRCDSAETSYWYLEVTTTAVNLWYFSAASYHNVSNWSLAVGTGKFWTFRVIHVGSEVAVFHDGGYGAADYGYPTTELTPRTAANANVPSAGVFGFKSTSQTVYVKDVTVGNGVTPPAPTTFTPAEATQVKPWTGDRTSAASNLEYLRLEDAYGNTLNLLPSYEDIRLREANFGSPSARQVLRQRPLGNGSISYTKFHGEKTVQLTLRARKTAYHDAQYYSDLVQRWTRPGWKSVLVYKPRGMNERRINIEGTSLGRSAIKNTGNQFIDLDVAFLAPDGGDYETALQTLNLTVATAAIATSYGSLQTEPIIRIYGPCTNPIIYNQTVEAYYPGTLARLGLTVVLDATEFVELDTQSREVRYMGLTDLQASYQKFLTTREWFYLEPLRNTMYYTSDDVAGSARVTYHDKY